MKKLSFSMLAMTGLLLASCADKDVIAESGGQQGEVLSDGYMALAINLPTTSATRAANDNFDDPEDMPGEYKVNSCAILFFEGSNENNATLFSAQNVLMADLEQTDDIDKDNVTATYQYVTKVSGRTTSGGNLYALALLNYDNVLSFGSDGIPTIKSVRSTSSTETGYRDKALNVGQNGDKLSDISALITNLSLEKLIGADKNNFFMTNAVLSTTPGGSENNPADNITGTGGQVTISKRFQLAEVDPNKIYDSPEKAKRNPAGEIFVERAVAKATLSLKDGYANETGLTFGAITWTLDNMEPTTYVVRNPGDNSYISYASDGITPSYYRFVSHTPTTVNTALVSNPFYRTYWCVDPQYDDRNMTQTAEAGSDGTPAQYNSVNMIPYTSFGLRGVDNPQYCFENTFDVKHQSYRNTTRAIIKVELTSPNNVFYTVNGGSAIYTEENATSLVKDQIVKTTDVRNAFNSNLKTPASSDEEVNYEITDEDFAFTFARNSQTGQYELRAVTLAEGVEDNDAFEEGNSLRDDIAELFEIPDGGSYNDNDIISNANNSIVIFKYEGKMYYEARFKHFAGTSSNLNNPLFDSAPWNTWELQNNGVTNPASGTTNEAYPDYSAKNYLGRYGMVRNNWYDVEVTAFTNIGYPEIPSVTVKNPGYDDPDTPDDKLEDNIAVRIHVLSWAKRMQEWGF